MKPQQVSRKALVVAASSGLGAACAESLAREGIEVAICSHDKNRIQEAALRIGEATKSRIQPFLADLTDQASLQELGREVKAHMGKIDILVTNSGGPPVGTFSDLSRSLWEEGVRGVLFSVLELCRIFLPAMASQNWGRVVMISSIAARQPIDGLLVSSTLRAGLLGLVRSLAREYGPRGISINAVLPGYIATERLKSLLRIKSAEENQSLESIQSTWEEEIPLRRIGEPDELGEAVAFLCSERASYITGAALPVDGGYLQGIP